MAQTQTSINNLVDRIVNQFNGQRIGYPGIDVGECTAPISYYVQELIGQRVPSMYRARADGWGEVFPYQLSGTFSHENYIVGKAYPKGTILMWNSPHIAVVESHDGSNNVTVFQQNADPDHSVCKVANRVINNQFHTCTYALIPIVQAEATPPTPAQYTVTETYPQGKQVQLNKQPTNLWGMNYHFDYMAAHPVEVHGLGEIITVTNKVHHEDGYDYYRRDGQVDGFNVADCDDYTPPPPPQPQLSAPAAAPIEIKKAEMYSVVTPLMGFETYKNAQSHSGQALAVVPGDYYVWDAQDGVKLLGKSNMTKPSPETWVNVRDNVIEEVKLPPKVSEVIQAAAQDIPKPEPVPALVIAPTTPVADTPDFNSWKICTPVNPDLNTGKWRPKKYVTTNDIQLDIRSLDGKLPATLPLPAHKELDIVCFFTGPDGKKYARDDLLTSSHRYYALSWELLKPVELPSILQPLDRDDDGDIDMSDVEALGQTFVDYPPKRFKASMDVLTRTVSVIRTVQPVTTVKAKKFVDGFVNKRKKVQ